MYKPIRMRKFRVQDIEYNSVLINYVHICTCFLRSILV